MTNAKQQLIAAVTEAIAANDFIKLTLSKPHTKHDDLRRVSLKPVMLKTGTKISFTYQFQHRDEVKNYSAEQALEVINELLNTRFFEANLFTVSHHSMLLFNKNSEGKIITTPFQAVVQPDLKHDKQKNRLIDASKPHWYFLGLTDRNGNILPSMQHKFKQINKYIEILDGLIAPQIETKILHIADMGAGKGYLTFALYEYLLKRSDIQPIITGIEQRIELVEKTNEIAQKAEFEHLHFEVGNINTIKLENVDVLIALHACDTATDDAIAAGIKANAKLIVCAPCCHKQIRNAMNASDEALPMLRFGILFERQAEILTDTLRAMIMEKHGYKTQIMEFIDAGHTPKNLLLTGIKSNKKIDVHALDEKINRLKLQYGIKAHYLETAMIAST